MTASSGSGMSMTWDHKNMTTKHRAAKVVLAAATDILMSKHAIDTQSRARKNAPWTDQTSNARNGLMAESFRNSEGIGVSLGHSVDYGIMLETARGGKYRVVMPTLEKELSLVIKSLNKLLKAL